MAWAARLGTLSVWLLLGAGCDVFDAKLEELIVAADAGRDAGGEPEVDAGIDAGGPTLVLADTCSSPRTRVTGSMTPLAIPITGLRSNASESGQCDIAAGVLAGAEGFFEISARAGDRWHFHLDAAEGQNLAVLASTSCDDLRECVASADVCGTKESEHFTFIPDKTGVYIVAVEGLDPSLGTDLSLLAVNPTCGDTHKEHSEVCDDGNITRGDGCDEVCRLELRGNPSDELEPNDDTFGANVLTPPRLDQPLVMRGKIAGGACQPDFYLLRVDSAQLLSAQVLDASGDPCTAAPELELTLLSSEDGLRGKSELKRNRTTDGSCPVLERPIAAGAYFIRVRHLKPADQFDYQLELTLTSPPPT